MLSFIFVFAFIFMVSHFFIRESEGEGVEKLYRNMMDRFWSVPSYRRSF